MAAIYPAFAFFAGFVAKMYDDLYDNPLFRSIKKKNKTLMEGLKGLHYISCTTISLDSPSFFLLNYCAVIVQYLIDKPSYVKPYEKSVLYSFSILFIPVLYKISQTGLDFIFNFVNIGFILLTLIIGVSDSFIFTEEVSHRKLYFRLFVLLFMSFSLIKYYDKLVPTMRYTYIYFSGYLFLSIFVQYYSLFLVK